MRKHLAVIAAAVLGIAIILFGAGLGGYLLRPPLQPANPLGAVSGMKSYVQAKTNNLGTWGVCSTDPSGNCQAYSLDGIEWDITGSGQVTQAVITVNVPILIKVANSAAAQAGLVDFLEKYSSESIGSLWVQTYLSDFANDQGYETPPGQPTVFDHVGIALDLNTTTGIGTFTYSYVP